MIDVAPKLLTTAQNIVTQLNKLDEVKKTVSGTSVSVSDVSHVEHNVGVNLTSKNLLDMSSLVGTSKTANGGTLSVGEDGGITGSGTPTGGVELPYVFIYNPPKTTLTFSRGGTFKNITCSVLIRNGATNLTSFTLAEYSTQQTKTLNLADYPTADNILFNVKRNNNNVAMSGTMYLQCELGDTATAYTPYTTDFSAMQVSRHGKNLFDINQITYISQNYITFDGCSPNGFLKEGNTFTAQGVEGSAACAASAGQFFVRFRDNPVASKGKTITVSVYITLLEQGKWDNRIRVWNCDITDKANDDADYNLTLGKRVKATLTFNCTIDTYCLIFRLNNNKVKIELDTLQIEYGDTATAYDPYKTPTTYTVSKNLFDSSIITDRTAQGVASVRNADGSITLSGTPTSTVRYISPSSDVFLTLPAGTYTISPSSFALRMRKTSDASSVLTHMNTFTITEECQLYDGYFQVPSGTAYNETVYPQLERGDAATEYTPFKSDGIVKGVTSLAPSMTLLSNNPATVINCKYFPTGSEQRQTTNAGILSVLKSIRSKFGKYP